MVGFQTMENRSKCYTERNKLMDQNPYQQDSPADYQTTPGSNHGKNIFLIVFTTVAAIIAIAAIVVSFLFLNHRAESDAEISEYEVDANGDLIVGEPVKVRENTPILQTYSELDEQTTIEDLLQKAKEHQGNIELTLTNDGTGVLKTSGSLDSIIFSHPLVSEEDVLTENEESLDESDGAKLGTTITDYPLDTPITEIRYTYDLTDTAYYIAYNDETKYYEIYNLDEMFELRTKKDAIEAYLAPVLGHSE